MEPFYISFVPLQAFLSYLQTLQRLSSSRNVLWIGHLTFHLQLGEEEQHAFN